jgi:hypothetical protein
VVGEKLLDQVNMREQHSATAITTKIQAVERVAFRIVCLQKSKIGVPFVAYHFATRKASNWNDHFTKK